MSKVKVFIKIINIFSAKKELTHGKFQESVSIRLLPEFDERVLLFHVSIQHKNFYNKQETD